MIVRFEMHFECDSDHAREDPAGFLLDRFKYIQGRMPLLMTDGTIRVRDENGNTVGRATMEISDD